MKVIFSSSLLLLLFLLSSLNLKKRQDQSEQIYFKKSINLKYSNVKWHYRYPFSDKTYVLAIAHHQESGKSSAEIDEYNAVIYFGRDNGMEEKVFWKEKVNLTPIAENIQYQDYNSDGTNDLMLFITTGARGGNAYYNLYLRNTKTKSLTKIDGFDQIINPTYNKKHKVIVSYGLAGTNYYSLYKFTKTNKIVKVGEPFEDKEGLDLDKKIVQILKQSK